MMNNNVPLKGSNSFLIFIFQVLELKKKLLWASKMSVLLCCEVNLSRLILFYRVVNLTSKRLFLLGFYPKLC